MWGRSRGVATEYMRAACGCVREVRRVAPRLPAPGRRLLRLAPGLPIGASRQPSTSMRAATGWHQAMSARGPGQ
eukprot:8895949-Alexandrium_andersonii.AAC.1